MDGKIAERLQLIKDNIDKDKDDFLKTIDGKMLISKQLYDDIMSVLNNLSIVKNKISSMRQIVILNREAYINLKQSQNVERDEVIKKMNNFVNYFDRKLKKIQDSSDNIFKDINKTEIKFSNFSEEHVNILKNDIDQLKKEFNE